MRRRYMSNKTKVFKDTIVQFENDKSGGYSFVEVKGDFAEGTTFELTRCGRNLINTVKMFDGYIDGVSGLINPPDKGNKTSDYI